MEVETRKQFARGIVVNGSGARPVLVIRFILGKNPMSERLDRGKIAHRSNFRVIFVD